MSSQVHFQSEYIMINIALSTDMTEMVKNRTVHEVFVLGKLYIPLMAIG